MTEWDGNESSCACDCGFDIPKGGTLDTLYVKNIKGIADLIYPVGSIYISIDPTDPSELFGGTWERIEDRFLLAAGSDHEAGEEGGAESVTISIDGHKHTIETYDNVKFVSSAVTSGSYDIPITGTTKSAGSTSETISTMPPYVTVYVWRRVADVGYVNLLDSVGNSVTDANAKSVMVTSTIGTGETYQSTHTGEEIDAGIDAANEALERIENLSTTPGADGKSAYEIALDNGFDGTEEEWLESLKGANGRDGFDGENGQNGKSAFEIAVEHGFDGSESEWLASLHGKDGRDGVDGTSGKSAYEYAVDGGYEGSESKFAEDLANVGNGSGGTADSVAWKNITGKPFGGLITGTAEIDGDALKWDGDYVNMPVSIGSKYVNWNYVSDNVPTKADMQAGYELYVRSYAGSEARVNIAPTYYDNGDIYIGDIDGAYLRIVAVPNETYPRAGVYFEYDLHTYTNCLKINGYTWTECSEIAPIPDVYIPSSIARTSDVEALNSKVDGFYEQANEITREITWDGVVGDRTVVADNITGYQFAHVADFAPAISMLEDGFTMTVMGSSTDMNSNYLSHKGDDHYNIAQMGAWVIMKDNVTVTVGDSSTTFPKAGTYFAFSDSYGAIVTELTSPVMQAQEDRIVLKKEHIPNDIIPVRGVDYWTEADKQEIINAVLAALGGGVTKPTLTVDANGNATISGTTFAIDADGNATIGSAITVDANGNATM